MKTSEAPKPRTVRRRLVWLLLPLMLVTVAAAVLTRDRRREVEIATIVSFTHLSDDLLLVDLQRPAVRLKVSATPAGLREIDAGGTACRIDLAGLDQGSHTLPIRAADVSLPKGVSLLALLTPSLTIRLGPVVKKTVGVVAVLSGNPAPGYAVSAVTLKPDRIVLRGTGAMLEGIETVMTRPIDLEGAAESFKKEVPLNLDESIDVEPPLRIVVADIQVHERIVTRVLENIPVSEGQHAGSVEIHPDCISLTVSGPETIVNAIEKNPAFTVTIDLQGLAPGTYQLKAAIHLPLQVTLKQITPEHFTVVISD